MALRLPGGMRQTGTSHIARMNTPTHLAGT